ncbi:hypothetical protein ALP8811_01109 [Aliiroseovarius pelagivivens]|uniref:Uncharacterized protein n=1 Tax=Aliiroseovarius pelagivivens TaxID=1639690 RepID=A0A2R8AJP3_9RHOB|nr:hypothetical protein [Aliiroseovarius pelagivivens]SPF76109.1 hypothetical protein ALP8811_01109 [Aliiroseovarius pelagivivens]
MKAKNILDTLRYFAVVTAISIPAVGYAQVMAPAVAIPQGHVVQAGYDDLKQTDQRRLDFYAQKIVIEILATVAANEAGDTAGFNKHGNAMKSTAERYLEAAEKVGLTEAEADLVFHQHLITGYEGPLPAFMVTSTGPAGIRALISMLVPESNVAETDYLDSIRDAGGDTFGNE